MLTFAVETSFTLMASISISTPQGNIKVRLYDETPLHRDNFLKLAREGFYNGTLLHRIIENFMIQGGDPESKDAKPEKNLGTGGPGYTLPAEIVDGLFHKRGALAAARLGDEVNPNRESSGSQFYIVWGQTYSLAKLKQLEKQIVMQREQQIFAQLAAEHREEIMNFRRSRNREGLSDLQERLTTEAKRQVQAKGPVFTDEMCQVYETIGGTPFLDGQYTVFGEVTEGLDVVERLQQSATSPTDRPLEDICIEMSINEDDCEEQNKQQTSLNESVNKQSQTTL